MTRLVTGYLLESAANRRERLMEKINRGRLKAYVNEAERLWVGVEKADSPPESLGGVDGSSAELDFKGFTLYAATGVSHSYGRSREGYKLQCTCRFIDVDVLEPPVVAERIGLYREILEAKAAYHALKKTSVLLMDGSLISSLIKPAPFEQVSLPEARAMAAELWGGGVFSELQSLFEENLPMDNGLLASKQIVEENPPGGRGYINAVILLEYLEKLLSYKAVLEEASTGRRMLIFVSKTSRSHLYFDKTARRLGRHPPPDIYVFEVLNPPPGYSKPLRGELPKFLPDEYGLADYFRSISVAVSYVRLVDSGPLLRVEIPFAEPGDMEKLIGLLAPLSPDGYPHPLHEAHMACRVSRRDLVDVARMLGIDVELTGREVLGEWM